MLSAPEQEQFRILFGDEASVIRYNIHTAFDKFVQEKAYPRYVEQLKQGNFDAPAPGAKDNRTVWLFCYFSHKDIALLLHAFLQSAVAKELRAALQDVTAGCAGTIERERGCTLISKTIRLLTAQHYTLFERCAGLVGKQVVDIKRSVVLNFDPIMALAFIVLGFEDEIQEKTSDKYLNILRELVKKVQPDLDTQLVWTEFVHRGLVSADQLEQYRSRLHNFLHPES